MNTNVVAILH